MLADPNQLPPWITGNPTVNQDILHAPQHAQIEHVLSSKETEPLLMTREISPRGRGLLPESRGRSSRETEAPPKERKSPFRTRQSFPRVGNRPPRGQNISPRLKKEYFSQKRGNSPRAKDLPRRERE